MWTQDSQPWIEIFTVHLLNTWKLKMKFQKHYDDTQNFLPSIAISNRLCSIELDHIRWYWIPTCQVWGGITWCCLTAALQEGIVPRNAKLKSCAAPHAHAPTEKTQFAPLAAVLGVTCKYYHGILSIWKLNKITNCTESIQYEILGQ